ncbi:MAG: HTH domain-containing protein [Candidatus Zixiibacteriota bacterium]
MEKHSRVLRLISLLQSRKHVTVATFKRFCGIHERSVYRYINTISEADIPVYYDRTLKAYCLARPVTYSLENLAMNESVLLVIALRLLRLHVGGEYRTEIDALLKKTVSHQSFPVEETLAALDNELGILRGRPDLTHAVSWALVQAAILNRRRVRVSVEDQSSQREIEIDEPRLRFKNGWTITPRDKRDDVGTPLSRVKKVKVA